MKSIHARGVAQLRSAVLSRITIGRRISWDFTRKRWPHRGNLGSRHSRRSSPFVWRKNLVESRSSQPGPLIAPIYAPLLPFGRKEIRDMFIKRQNERRARDGAGLGKQAPLMPCALNQPIAFLYLSRLSLTRTTALSLSTSSFSHSRWQPLHLRSVLIFGGALIYQRVYPSTTRTHPRSILHSLHSRHAHEHPESKSALTRPASKFIRGKVPFLSSAPRQ